MRNTGALMYRLATSGKMHVSGSPPDDDTAATHAAFNPLVLFIAEATHVRCCDHAGYVCIIRGHRVMKSQRESKRADVISTQGPAKSHRSE
jgi:hypothetical protein